MSGVAVLNSRSGLGTGRPLTGAVSLAVGGFGTAQGSLQLGGERGRVGLLRLGHDDAHRPLPRPGVARQPPQRRGTSPAGSDASTCTLGDRTHLRAARDGRRARASSWPTSARSRRHGQDQRQALNDVSTWGSLVHTLGTASTLEATRRLPRDDGRAASERRRHAGDGRAGPAAVHRTPAARCDTRACAGATCSAPAPSSSGSRSTSSSRWGITSPSFNEPGSDGYNEALAAVRPDAGRFAVRVQ